MTSSGDSPDFDTVVLAGGRASRMGGADKPGLVVGGTPMLVSVAQAAVAAGTSRLIQVGPARPGLIDDGLTSLAPGRSGWLTRVEEEPPGSGPVAGLRRGLAEATAPWLLLLAADLPFLRGEHLTALRGAVGTSGVVPVDRDGHRQWLTSFWRTESLRPALAAYAGDSLGGLLAPLEPAIIRLDAEPGAPPPWLDCDTPGDLATARRAWTAGSDGAATTMEADDR